MSRIVTRVILANDAVAAPEQVKTVRRNMDVEPRTRAVTRRRLIEKHEAEDQPLSPQRPSLQSANRTITQVTQLIKGDFHMVFSLKRRPRTVLAAVASVALVACIAGCSTSPSDTSSGAGGKKTNLTLEIWDPAQTQGVQKAIDGFEVANTNISVDLEQVPNNVYNTRLQASLGAGQGPDVMWQSSTASQYANGGALESLDSYIKKDNLSLSAYPKKLVDLYNFNGHQYGIPKDQDVYTLIYNTAVFKKLGVTDLPTTNWTWDDMVRIAKELRAKQTSPSDFPLYYQYTFNSTVASLIHQLGGTVIKDKKGNVATPEATKALEMVKALQDDKLIPAVADSTDYNAISSLISGNLAMAWTPSWNLSLLDKSQSGLADGTLKAVPLPSVNGSRAEDTNGISYVMNANSAHKADSWKLIKYLTSSQGATLQAEGGAAMPANVSASVQAAYYATHDSIGDLKTAMKPMLSSSYLRTTTQYPAVLANNPQIEAALGDYYAGSISTADVETKIDELYTASFQ